MSLTPDEPVLCVWCTQRRYNQAFNTLQRCPSYYPRCRNCRMMHLVVSSRIESPPAQCQGDVLPINGECWHHSRVLPPSFWNASMPMISLVCDTRPTRWPSLSVRSSFRRYDHLATGRQMETKAQKARQKFPITTQTSDDNFRRNSGSRLRGSVKIWHRVG